LKNNSNSIDSVLRCIECGTEYESSKKIYTCEKCHDLLEVVNLEIELKGNREADGRERKLGIWRYESYIDVNSSLGISLGEGNTPLLRSRYLEESLGLERVFLKCEHLNPTGSFKDRGMAVGVTKARELGFKSVGCASTGNTSASLAAYSAAAELHAVVFLPGGGVAGGKLVQAIAHGAKIVEVRGSFDQAFEKAARIAEESGLYLLNSVNPWRIEGQKTAAYEVADELGGAPDYVILPMGNCGNISAYWKGFREYYDLGILKSKPRMVGVQASGSSPVADMLLEGRKQIAFVDEPLTVASAIRIGRPVSWKKAKKAIEESNGMATKVSDDEILEAQVEIARRIGLGVEPAGAASLAGLKKLISERKLEHNRTFVLVLTGQLLKDPESVDRLKPNLRELQPEEGKIGLPIRV
jgi:threonine synthase